MKTTMNINDMKSALVLNSQFKGMNRWIQFLKPRLMVLSAMSVLVLSFQNCQNAIEFAKANPNVGANGAGAGDPAGTTNPNDPNDYIGGVDPLTVSNPPPGNGGVTPSCQKRFIDISQRLNITFIVDNSTSTLTTDPNKNYRNSSISQFMSRYRTKANFSWQFMYFNQNKARALVNSGNDQNPMFSSDPSSMDSALSNFLGLTPLSSTPYLAALGLADRSVAVDPELNSAANPSYAFIFLSDGQPTDTNSKSVIFSKIQGLRAKAPGRVSLSTVYFGQDSSNDLRLMAEMAQVGFGRFADTNKSQSVQLDDVATIPQVLCQ
jgi:hypothetical protein